MNPSTPFDRLSLELLVSSAGCTLDAGPKLALIALVQHYNDRSGQCFPSMKTIARLSGNISEKQARRHVNALIALGLVTSVPRAGRSCCYRFHVAAIQALACHARGADTPAEPRTFEPATPDIGDLDPSHACPSTPPMGVPLTEGGTEKELGGTGIAPSFPVFKPLKTEDPAPADTELAVAIAPDTLAAVNAQRVTNGKAALKRAEMLDLGREAILAGIAPQAAAEWILARPGRNFFRADFASAASLTTPAVAAAVPVEISDAGRAALALRARYEAGIVLPQSAGPIAAPARPVAQLQTVTLRRPAPTAMGGSIGTGWARTAVTRFTAGEAVGPATIKDAATALGLSLADLKAQRAAAMGVAA